MKIQVRKLRRFVYGTVAAVLALALGTDLVIPSLMRQASAAQVTTRSIEMSSSAPSATSTSYTVVFTPGTSTTVGGIVVDICDNDPIIGDTSCTYPAGFDWGGSTPSLTVNSGMGSGWTAAGVQGGAGAGVAQTLKLSNATPQSLLTSTPVNFTITSVTNPSTGNHTFYARIVTFTTSATMANYTVSTTTRASSFTGQVDYGGAALSTANVLNITAKVQEQLTFCLYTGVNCAAAGSAVALGDTNGVLSTSGPFVDRSTKYDVSTNASAGVAIRLQGGTLTSGSNTIPGLASPTASSAGTSQFGLCTFESAGTTLTPVANYNGGGAVCNSSTSQTAGTGTPGGAGTATFYFPTATTSSTYGDVVANATAGAATGTAVFLGNTSLTQQAGIYTTALKFIATGTF